MKKHADGYFLLYLLIGLSLIIVTLSVTVPYTAIMQRFLVRAHIEQLYSLCLYLQQRALLNQQNQELQIDIATNSYQLQNIHHTLPAGVQLNFIPGSFGPPSSPKTIITKPSTFAHNSITFQGDGLITPGTLYCTDRTRTTMYALTSGIAQKSYLRLYRYSYGQWIQLQ